MKKFLLFAITIAFAVSISLGMTGCKAKVVAPGETAAQTLLHQIAIGNDMLANANQQMGVTVTNLTSSGVMDMTTALTLKRINVQVAQMDNQLTPIIDAANNGTVNWATANAQLNAIITMVTNGVQSAQLGIKNQQSQAAVVAALQAVSGVAQAIIEEIVQVQALTAASASAPATAPATH